MAPLSSSAGGSRHLAPALPPPSPLVYNRRVFGNQVGPCRPGPHHDVSLLMHDIKLLKRKRISQMAPIYLHYMNRVGKVVPPKRHILKNISSLLPGAKIGG